MKRLLFIAAATAVALSSCSENEVLETPDALKSEIQLSTYVGTTTKATVVESSTFTEFACYAYQAAADATTGITATELTTSYIAETSVTRTAGDANATTATECTFDNGPYYWPTTGYMYFYAYAPYKVDAYTVETDATSPTLTYTASTTMADQSDVLVAKVNAVECSTQTSTSTVDLPFSHALTQIAFSVVGDATAFDYYVTSIEITGVTNSGVYNFVDVSWTAASGATTTAYPYTLDYDASSSPSSIKVVGKTAETSLTTSANGSLMLIPQTLSAQNIVVKYYVTETDKPAIRIKDFTSTGKSISLSGTEAWTAGKSITYAVTLPNDANQIVLKASVGAWTTESEDLTVQ